MSLKDSFSLDNPPAIFQNGLYFLSSDESAAWTRRKETGWVGFKNLECFMAFWFRIKRFNINIAELCNFSFWYEAEWYGPPNPPPEFWDEEINGPWAEVEGYYIQTGGVYAYEFPEIGEVTITRREPTVIDYRSIAGWDGQLIYSYEYGFPYLAGSIWGDNSKESKIIANKTAIFAGSKTTEYEGEYPFIDYSTSISLGLGTGSFLFFDDDEKLQIPFGQPVVDTDGSIWLPISIIVSNTANFEEEMPEGFVDGTDLDNLSVYNGDTVKVFNGGLNTFAGCDGNFLSSDYYTYLSPESYSPIFANIYNSLTYLFDYQYMTFGEDLADLFVAESSILVAIYNWNFDGSSYRLGDIEIIAELSGEDGFLEYKDSDGENPTWNKDTGLPE